MRKIDIGTWSRKGVWESFSTLGFPFYHVSFPVDVKALYDYTKRESLPFYYALVYVISKAVNEVPNFRHRIRNGEVWEIDEAHPSLTFMKKGSEAFQIVTVRLTDTMREFCEHTQQLTSTQETFIGGEIPPNDELIYLSCLPWMEVTCVNSERGLDIDDSIPRITWGKYTEQDRKLVINVTVDVNHRLIDGYHIGRLSQILQERLSAFKEKVL